MATGLLPGGRGDSQGLSASFWSWKLPGDLWSGRVASWRSSNLVTLPWELAAGTGGPAAGGHSRWTGGAACLARASRPVSLWHTVFPQIGQLLGNKDEPEAREPRQHCVDEDASALGARLPKLPRPCQIHLRQAVAQAHTGSAFASVNVPASGI